MDHLAEAVADGHVGRDGFAASWGQGLDEPRVLRADAAVGAIGRAGVGVVLVEPACETPQHGFDFAGVSIRPAGGRSWW